MQTCKSSREASPLAKKDHSKAEAKGLVSKDLPGLHFPWGLLSVEKGLPKLVYFSIKTLIPRENRLLAPLTSLLERVQGRLWPAYGTWAWCLLHNNLHDEALQATTSSAPWPLVSLSPVSTTVNWPWRWHLIQEDLLQVLGASVYLWPAVTWATVSGSSTGVWEYLNSRW